MGTLPNNPIGHDPTSDPGIPRRTQSCSCPKDHGQGLYLRTNQIKQMCGLIPYMKYVFAAYNSDIDPRDDPFHPFTPDEWSQ